MEIQENSKEKEEISKNTTFELVETKEKLDICIKLRHLIFVIEQNVPLDLEIDGEDEKSDHGLLFLKEIPVGVIRIRFIEEEGIAKIERVGILEEYRGMGLGVMLMKFSVDYIKTKALDKKIKEIKLSSQTYIIPFYQKLGFIVCSEEYMNANITHKDMKMALI